MEQRRHAGLLDRPVDRVERLVVREERLDVRVELEAAHAVVADEAANLVDGVGAVRVDAAERDEHVGVGGGGLGDLLVRDRAGRPCVSASTVKTTAAMLRSR